MSNFSEYLKKSNLIERLLETYKISINSDDKTIRLEDILTKLRYSLKNKKKLNPFEGNTVD